MAADGRAERLARYYDLDLTDDPGDLTLYQALAARTGGPVLELGVGTGRLAVPLAQAGYEVTGVDDDPAMLERAERAWGAVSRGARSRGSGALRLMEADLCTVDLGARFALAFIALSSLLLLDETGQADALRALTRHLAPRGLAVVDAWLPTPDDLSLLDGRLQLEWLREDPETSESVAKLAAGRIDPATATVTLDVIFDATPREGGPVHRVARTDRLRLVTARELTRMVADAGLRVDTLAGDYDMSPLGPGSSRLVIVGGL